MTPEQREPRQGIDAAGNLISTHLPVREALRRGRALTIFDYAQWIRGDKYDVREIIRELSRKRRGEGRVLEVAEVGRSAPSKAPWVNNSEILEKTIGSDLIESLYLKGHKTKTRATIISDRDYLRLVLDSRFGEEYADIQADWVRDAAAMLGAPVRSGESTETRRRVTSYTYREQQAKDDLVVMVDSNTIAALKKVTAEGKRYDIVFADLASEPDRINFLGALQESLNYDGVALVPLQWIESFGEEGEGKGTRRFRLVDDWVKQGENEVPLQEYLVKKYGGIFEIYKNAAVELLVVHGTGYHLFPPVRDFPVEKRPYHQAATGMAFTWTAPDVPTRFGGY